MPIDFPAPKVAKQHHDSASSHKGTILTEQGTKSARGEMKGIVGRMANFKIYVKQRLLRVRAPKADVHLVEDALGNLVLIFLYYT